MLFQIYVSDRQMSSFNFVIVFRSAFCSFIVTANFPISPSILHRFSSRFLCRLVTSLIKRPASCLVKFFFSNALRQLSEDLRRKRGGPSSEESTVEWVPFSQQRPNEPDCGPICVQAIAQLSMEPECDDVKISTSERGVERLRMRQAFDLSRSTTSN